jgi:peptidoglycan hydrolase-like protein with peptidoglycan-binding domain
MRLKLVAGSAVVAAMVAGSASRAMADSDALVGAIVGGIIGGAIVNEANKNRTKKKTTTTSGKKTTSTANSAQREANREVQTALNYFGFPVGTPDGQIGPRTRAAITEYQITMGFPGTGELNAFERDLLVSSYYRAQAGGATTAALITQNPRGAKGVLLSWKDERLGVAPATVAPVGEPLNPFVKSGTTAAAPETATTPGAAILAGTTPAAPGTPAPEPAPLPTFGAAAPEPEPAPAASPALPSFLASSTAEPTVSLASYCSKVSLVTNSNGGFVTQVTMTDPNFALSEQFCLARTYGMAQGEELTAKVAGFSAADIAAQCKGFAPVLKAYVDGVGQKPRDAVLLDVAGFVQSSGMPASQLAGTAKICLGVGYSTDDMDVALGSALLLTAMGEKSYGELVGHHLSQGIGAEKRPDLALAWYEGALGIEGEEVVSVFAPGMTDRAGLIRMAAYAAAGTALPGGAVTAAPEAVAPAAVEQPSAEGGGSGFLPFKLPYVGKKNEANP